MYVFRPFFFSLFFFSRPIVFFLRIHFVGYHINLFTSRLPPSADVTTGHFTSCSVTASLLVTERVAAVARTRTQRILTPTHTHSVYYSHTYTHAHSGQSGVVKPGWSVHLPGTYVLLHPYEHYGCNLGDSQGKPTHIYTRKVWRRRSFVRSFGLKCRLLGAPSSTIRQRFYFFPAAQSSVFSCCDTFPAATLSSGVDMEADRAPPRFSLFSSSMFFSLVPHKLQEKLWCPEEDSDVGTLTNNEEGKMSRVALIFTFLVL